MRFVGWSVDRVDGSSSFGTFDRRETADEWCERLRGYGNDVHVVRAEVSDERPPIDWPARFRAAAEVAERDGWGNYAALFSHLAGEAPKCEVPPEVVEAIGRALLGEAP
jgi:hypothetical protein